MKKLSAVQFDGITFGMGVDTQSKAYKNFKKHITNETVIGLFGKPVDNVLCVPNVWLGAIMGEAHWLVTEIKAFDKFRIEGLFGGEDIYVKYKDGALDLSNRF